jgi:hypothetical protein
MAMTAAHDVIIKETRAARQTNRAMFGPILPWVPKKWSAMDTFSISVAARDPGH